MDEAEGQAPGTADVWVARFEGERGRERADAVACEEPLQIELGAAPLAVVMRTPGHDEDLTLGLLVAEGVIRRPEDVASVRHCAEAPSPEAEGNLIRAVLAEGVALDLEGLRRNLYASSSCGICGKATIENALAAVRPVEDGLRLSPAYFHPLPERLRAAQAGFERSGGLHAAGLFDARGELLVAREDVGRHNAVDKVVGWALRRRRLPLRGHVLLVSGRISFEIVQKAAVAGIPVVAAVSAPSSLAVRFAESAGLTLVGFLRGRALNVYGRRERVAPDGAAGAADAHAAPPDGRDCGR